MKKPAKSKVIIIPNPPQNASKQEETVQNNVPVEAVPAPAQAPAQNPPVQAEAAEESEE